MTGREREDPRLAEELPAQVKAGVSRKTLLKAAVVAAPVPILVAAVPAIAWDSTPNGQSLEPTPMCDDGDDPTIPQMEGPYFKPGSPQRSTLTGGTGTRLVVSGVVYGLGCQPIPNVLLDFWQADNNGAYDNVTYRFRGHQYTDANGRYQLTTIVPGLYPGRTRHIHVKAQAPGRPVLTTQLYFPGEPRNNTDTIYDPRLLMNVRQVGTGREATFDFVLNVQQTTRPPQTTSPPPQTTTPPQTTSPPPQTTQPPSGTWTAWTYYALGARVSYNGLNYQCRQAHTAYPGWEPPNTPALWLQV